MESNKRNLPRPSIVFTVGESTVQGSSEKSVQFTVCTSNFTVNVALGDDGKLITSYTEKRGEDFIHPFNELVKQNTTISHLALFLEWLFQKIDLEVFEMKYLTAFEEVYGRILEVMLRTHPRCFKILMKQYFKFSNPGNFKRWTFFQQLYETQKALGVSMELQVETEGGLNILSHAHHVDILNYYGNLIPKVVCIFRSIWIYSSMYAICARWINGGLNAIKFTLRFTYASSGYSDSHMANASANQFKDLKLQFDNISEEVFKRIGTDNILPKEILVYSNDTDEIIKFKVMKLSNLVEISVDFVTK